MKPNKFYFFVNSMHYKILIQVLNLETIFPSRGRKKRRKENLNFFFAYKCERWKVHF